MKDHPYRDSAPTEPPPSRWRRLLCAIGRHEFEWGGRWLIKASAITRETRLESMLVCHFCPRTVGPQLGSFISDGAGR